MRLALALLMLMLASPAAACGLSDVCTDVGVSFSGWVVVDGIRLSWSTDAEDGTVYAYQLERRVGSTWTAVATVYAGQQCLATAPYQITDTRPAEEHRISVWGYGSSASCTVGGQP